MPIKIELTPVFISVVAEPLAVVKRGVDQIVPEFEFVKNLERAMR
jgi:hypothetical protein